MLKLKSGTFVCFEIIFVFAFIVDSEVHYFVINLFIIMAGCFYNHKQATINRRLIYERCWLKISREKQRPLLFQIQVPFSLFVVISYQYRDWLRLRLSLVFDHRPMLSSFKNIKDVVQFCSVRVRDIHLKVRAARFSAVYRASCFKDVSRAVSRVRSFCGSNGEAA